MLTCGDQETVKKLESGIEIVNGWFMERGNSVLNVFCCELLRVYIATEQTSFFWVAKSRDSVGCARTYVRAIIIPHNNFHQ